jgi:uncharacterized membrane protein
MADRRGIGNRIAPPRFLLFVALLIVGTFGAGHLLHAPTLGFMAGFDFAAVLFLASCAPLLGGRSAAEIRRHATANDANRTMLLGITGVVMAVLLVAIGAEAMGGNPEPFTKGLIIFTLAIAWLFSNTIYALHYAHLAYGNECHECSGLDFPDTAEPDYGDFLYFAFTCGMAFATSDVQVTSRPMRRVVTAHSLAAFAFNIGVLAFTINVLGSGG